MYNKPETDSDTEREDNKEEEIESETEKAVKILMEEKRIKLLGQIDAGRGKMDTRGSHYKEAGCLLKLRSMTAECLTMIPRDGCSVLQLRASYWDKLEMMKETISQAIRHASNWDQLNTLEEDGPTTSK
ncbi:hypothetical protein GPALN_014542 [Globodera pallida]|nr:hypothetical protein GPALN_014541 [Globodera pallida]KAI3420914.1 hypothetical protein GPALN_014542 [Globodera pallida]